MKDDVNVYSFSGSDVESSNFGFCDGCHDMFDDMSKVEDVTIVGWDVSSSGQKEVAAGTAACFGLTEITSVAVCSKDHVAGMVSDNSIFFGG